MPFILRGVHLLGVDSVNCPMSMRQKIWNKLAVEWRPDRVHDQVRTIDFDELPTHFDAYLKGMVRGRTVVRIAPGLAPLARRRRLRAAPSQRRVALGSRIRPACRASGAAGRPCRRAARRRVRRNGVDDQGGVPCRRTRSSIAARSTTATRSGASRRR